MDGSYVSYSSCACIAPVCVHFLCAQLLCTCKSCLHFGSSVVCAIEQSWVGSSGASMTFLERGNVGKATTLLAGTRVVQHYSGVPSIVRKLLLIVQAGLQESLGHTGKPYVCVTFRMRPCKKGWRICAHHVRFIAQFHQGNSYECHKAATERATQSVTRSGSHMTKSLMLAGLSDMAMDERISAHLSELPT